MTKFFVNVFAGSFADHNMAMRYSNWRYDEDPDTPVSDFSKDFEGLRYDEDFIETIWGEDRLEYLETLLVYERDADVLAAEQSEGDNTFILVMEIEGNCDIQIPRVENKGVRYCGRFEGCFRDD